MEEENRSFSNKASTFVAPYLVEQDDDMDEDGDGDEDGDEEMILDSEVVLCPFFFQPAMDGEVDPSILAALPPSMQLDHLVQVSLCVLHVKDFPFFIFSLFDVDILSTFVD